MGAKNVEDNSVNFDCSDIEESLRNTVLKNSVLRGRELLITMTGTIGKCGAYPEGVGEANINQAVAKIISDEQSANAKYVSTFLNSLYGQLQFSQSRHGVGTPNINLEEIKTIKIILPERIEEQIRILNKLGSIKQGEKPSKGMSTPKSKIFYELISSRKKWFMT